MCHLKIDSKIKKVNFFKRLKKYLPDEYCCVEGARIKNENWGGVVELWSDSWVGGGDLKESEQLHSIIYDKSSIM